jgi:hypothetical protein
MRTVLYIILGLFAVSRFSFCKSSDAYLTYAASIDSLSGAIGTLESQLRAVNESELTDLKSRYNAYSTFIAQHVDDTITKPEAEELQRFYEAGKQLDVFVENRKVLAERASILKKQLSDLSKDIRLKNTDVERLNEYFSNEKNSATEFANAARAELTSFLEASKQFRLSLPAVGNIIRKRNNGELPRVVEKTVL